MTVFKDIGTLPDQVAWRGAGVLARDAEGRILMQLRDDYAEIAAPGLWSCFGGEVEPGETVEQAARREFFEETGIDISGDALRPLVRIGTTVLNGGILHIYMLDRVVAAHEVRLGEGAGFAFLNKAQLARFDLIANLRETLGVLGII